MSQLRQKGRQFKRYSLSFKQEVVGEIESGKMSIFEARRRYGIGGSETIQKWLVKLGRKHLLNTVVEIKMKDDVDELRAAKQRIRELEAALADAHLQHKAAEALITVANRYYQTDLKKNFGTGQSNSSNRKPKTGRRK